MKFITKLGFAALLTATATTASVAQMYGGLQVGYSMPTAQGVLGTENTSTGTTSGTTKTSTNVYGTAGSGISFGLNAGYMFSEHFGVDLGATYNIASPVVIKNNDATGVGTTSKTTTTTNGNQIRVTPSLVVSAGNEGIKPYARFGVVIPVAGETITDYSEETTSTILGITSTTSEAYKVKTAGQFSVGFNSAIGVNIGLGEKMTIFGELALTTLTIKGQSSTYTAYEKKTATTTTTLADRTFAANNINFVDKLDNTSNHPSYNPTTTNTAGERTGGYDKDKAFNTTAPTSNYNSLGLNVGIRYKF